MRPFSYVLAMLPLLMSTAAFGAGRPEDAGNRDRGSDRGRAFSDQRIREALESRSGIDLDRLRDQTTSGEQGIGSQNGTGRLGSDTHTDRGRGPANGVDSDRLGGRDIRSFDDRRRSNDRGLFSRLGRRSSDERRIDRTNRKNDDSDDDATDSTEDSADDRSDSSEKSGRRHENQGPADPTDTLSRAERLLAQRLAKIDHLRDIALANGNTQLLAKADELEELARRQFLMRTQGQKLDWGNYKRHSHEGDDSTPPTDDTTPPADDTTPPADDTTPPADDTTPPADDTTPPADDTIPPADDTTPPADDTIPPADEPVAP